MSEFTHLDAQGAARMVDIVDKDITKREAIASSSILMKAETMHLLLNDGIKKGDVLAVARIAGIQAAKKCSDLIPLCHALQLSSVAIDFEADEKQCRMNIFAKVKLAGRTGVEMEALTAVSIAALTIYDMCKALEKEMIIGPTQLLMKEGGKSGAWQR